MRICIDLVYLNITGGRLIADLLIENLTRNLNYDIDFVTDKRLNYIINVDLSSRFNFYDIRASEIERLAVGKPIVLPIFLPSTTRP